MAHQEIRVVVVGPQASGKSSLVASVLLDRVPEQVDNVMAPVALPPHRFGLPSHCSLVMIDTPSVPMSMLHSDCDSSHLGLDEDVSPQCSVLRSEVSGADVVLVCYDMFQENQDELLLGYLPYVARVNDKVPIVLVGTKLDKYMQELSIDRVEELEDSEYWGQGNTHIQQLYQQHKVSQLFCIMRRAAKQYYQQVENGIEISAHQAANIDQLLCISEKCVSCPIQILYDYEQRELRSECIQAFLRIYRLINTAADNRLTLPELSLYNQKAYDLAVTQEEFDGILALIQEYTQEQRQPFISPQGFLALQQIMIERNKGSIAWQFLRTFHYDSRLDNSFLNDPDAALYVQQYRPMEISKRTHLLLSQLFARLAPSRRMSLSLLCSAFFDNKHIPWPNVSNLLRLEGDCLTLDLWIMLWSYLAFIDPLKCYRSLIFIGVDVTFETAFKYHYSSRHQLDKKNRHVLHCVLLGEIGSCHKLLLQLIDKESRPGPDWKAQVVLQVKHKVTQQRTVIFSAMSPDQMSTLLNDPQQQHRIDFVAVLDDYVDLQDEDTVQSLPIPIINISTRDAPDPNQIQTTNRCQVDLVNKNHQQLFNCVNSLALDPKQGLSKEQLRRVEEGGLGRWWWVQLGVAVGAVTMGAYLWRGRK